MQHIFIVPAPHAEIAVDVVNGFALHLYRGGQRMLHAWFHHAFKGEVFRDIRVVGECGRIACQEELHIHGVGSRDDAFTVHNRIEDGIFADLGLHIVLQAADHILKQKERSVGVRCRGRVDDHEAVDQHFA